MVDHVTQGFADELSKLSATLPAQGLRQAMKNKGLTTAAQSEQKSTLRAGDMHNIAATKTKNLANLPQPPRFDK